MKLLRVTSWKSLIGRSLAAPVLLMMLTHCAFAITLPAPGTIELAGGNSFSASGCYARLVGTKLIIGNSHVRRTWEVQHGLLFVTSVFDNDAQVEWIGVPAKLPSPTPPLTTKEARIEMRGGSGVFGPTEGESLRAELLATAGDSIVKYEFQVFPGARGIRMWLAETTGLDSVPPLPVIGQNANLPTVGDLAAPVERSQQAGIQPVADAIEHLQVTAQHLKFTQVTLLERTDERNELVFENEWLLHPNEVLLRLAGNLFFVENTLSGNGLLFLKEAPAPGARPVSTSFDAWISGSGMEASPRNSDKTRYFDLSFYGHGFASKGVGYPSTLICYQGGRSGRIAALQNYQRQLRQYMPRRDAQLISNTWGDRSANRKLNEAFVRKEIDAARALGVDIVEIDDGWQTGKTINDTVHGGVWEGYWEQNPRFWTPDPEHFPGGLLPLSGYAEQNGMRLGLWYAPDSSHDFKFGPVDADTLLAMYRTDHVAAYKLDSIKIRSKPGENNYRAVLDRLVAESSGKLIIEQDVTAETRSGYFGNISAGSVFVENRYTDWHSYWPHQTLRNLWKLGQYVDPMRLRMEFLNPDRNSALYLNDPLGPARYEPACLFAITMFSSPLAFLENSALSPRFVASAAPLIARWKNERDAIHRGVILPIGDVPDGTTWTGFASIAEDRRGGYLLVFRELSGQPAWTAPRSLFAPGFYEMKTLGGEGSVTESSNGFRITIPKELGFLWVKLTPSS